VWEYPETSKIISVDEFKGIDDLPKSEKDKLLEKFDLFSESKDHEKHMSKKRRLVET
jgi:hypothetical protein